MEHAYLEADIGSCCIDSPYIYNMVILRNIQEVFIWMVVSCAISSNMNRQKIIKIGNMATVKKFICQIGSFENTVNFIWQPMNFLENILRDMYTHVYQFQFVTILACFE